MPSKSILRANSHSPNIPGEAFWLSGQNPLNIESLKGEILDTQKKVQDLLFKKDSAAEIEECVKHLGYVTSSLIDSRVNNLSERMAGISNLYTQYNASNYDSSLRKMIIDESLSIGFDLQTETRKLMREIGISGTSINPDKFHGSEELKEVFVDVSATFPSSWNYDSMRSKNILLVKNERIGFDSKKLSFYKKENTSSFSENSYKYLNRDKFEIVYGKDGQYAYPSLNEAKKAEKTFPLEFYTKHEIVHEMSHMHEKNDVFIQTLTANFLNRRISELAKKSGNNTPLHYDYLSDSKKKVYADSFPNRLCGTIYVKDSRNNEIFARGVESVLYGANGSFVGLPKISLESKIIKLRSSDIDYRNLMLGILFGHRK